MTVRIEALSVDALDPPAQARFWAAALGWKVADDEPALVVPTDSTVAIRFEATTAPKVAPNPVHLDLSSRSLDDQAAFVERLRGLGATPADVGQTGEEAHVVLADPEGNEMCVLEPGNAFTDQASRFGSITCDGTRSAGVFWSEALGWPLIWDQHDETAVRAPAGTGPLVTWGGQVPQHDQHRRLRLVVVPVAPAAVAAEVDRLDALGATVVGPRPDGCVVLHDPDGVAFVLGPPA